MFLTRALGRSYNLQAVRQTYASNSSRSINKSMQALDKEAKHRVQIHVSLIELEDSAILNYKNPHVKVSWFDQGNRFEAVANFQPGIATPDADTPIELTYQFETKQMLSIVVTDTDLQSELFTQNITLTSLLTAPKSNLTLELRSKSEKVPGKVSLTAKPIDDGSNETAVIGFSCRKLAKMDTFSESDPYIVIHTYDKEGKAVEIHRTERYDDEPNPVFKKFEMSMKTLCDGDRNKVFLIKCWDYDTIDDDLIGSVNTTFAELMTGQELILYGPKREHNGFIKADILVHRRNCIVDYLLRGLNIQFSVAVDFTSSNGDLKNPKSLHITQKDGFDNSYQKAMREVSERILGFTGNEDILAMGFGAFAKFGEYNDISHCFPLSQKEWYVKGISGLLEAYENVRCLLKFNGFTVYEEIISKALEQAKNTGTKLLYSVSLILTDGDVTDVEAVNKLLDEAVDLPISFLVIGIGDQTSPNFQELGQGKFASSPTKFLRKVLNFVPFNEDAPKLAEELLKELPEQIAEYFHRKAL